MSLFKKSVAEADGNVIVSPISLSLNLSMLANGADGATLGEIYQAVGFEGLESDDVNRINSQLSYVLPTLDKNVSLSFANAIFADKLCPIEEEFARFNSDWYNAMISSDMDLASDKARATVNDWVNDKTNGLIPEFLGSNLSGTQLALFNCLYFKADWTQKFCKDFTVEAPFTCQDGTVSQVEMMHSLDKYRFAENSDGAKCVAMDYAGGDAFQFVAILPPSNVRIQNYVAGLTATELTAWQADMTIRDVRLSLPKFDISSDFDLAETMKSLGMQLAFTPAADFSRMSACEMYVDRIKQKTRVSVNEEGTVAAAATMVGMATESGVVIDYPEVEFDRPFVFFITEKSTGTILFAGTVNTL